MKVLVTGGAGFLGSNIAASFLESGCRVVVADALMRRGSNLNLKWLEEIDQGRGLLRNYRIDLADNESLENLFRNESSFDYVCHLGGQVAMTTSLDDPRRDFLTNAMGTLNVLESIRKYCPNAFLAYSSTNKVYGDLTGLRYVEYEKRFGIPDYPNGLDESMPLDFASPYGCSKGCADQYVRDWYRNFGIETVVFRHSSIFGGRQFSSFDQGWIGWFCSQAASQRQAIHNSSSVVPFTISGTGKQVRDVLHSSDLVVLYRRAFEERSSVKGKVFNIGGGATNSLSLLELFEILEEELDFPDGTGLSFDRLPRRKSDQDYFVADTSAIKKALGWAPAMNARDGIRLMLEWCKRSA